MGERGAGTTPWAWAELRDARLGDARLVQRLIAIASTFGRHPEKSIPQACDDWAAAKATYRFFANDDVDPQEVLEAHRRSTLRRVEGRDLILVVQDTTQFDFTAHRDSVAGMGPTGAPGLTGFFLHTALALTTEGNPLGLLDWRWWVREEDERGRRRAQRKTLSFEEKESVRWLRTLERSTAGLPAGTAALTVADREADIFELMLGAQELRQLVLVRAAWDRNVAVADEAKHLWAATEQAEPCGVVDVRVSRQANRPEREAHLSLQVAEVSIAPPKRLSNRHLPPVVVRAILAREINPPADEKPVEWLLLTSLPVRTVEDAAQCLLWYTYRWRIERFHFILKSGCNYEKLQLETADRLWRALSVYCVVAWRVLFIDLTARTHPTETCTTFLTQDEWQALCCHRAKRPDPPAAPPDARTAVRWIAMLGGFLGRRHDGEPGVKTLWRGFCRLQDITEMWRVMHRRQ